VQVVDTDVEVVEEEEEEVDEVDVEVVVMVFEVGDAVGDVVVDGVVGVVVGLDNSVQSEAGTSDKILGTQSEGMADVNSANRNPFSVQKVASPFAKAGLDQERVFEVTEKVVFIFPTSGEVVKTTDEMPVFVENSIPLRKSWPLSRRNVGATPQWDTSEPVAPR